MQDALGYKHSSELGLPGSVSLNLKDKFHEPQELCIFIKEIISGS